MNISRYILLCAICYLSLSSCKKPFYPNVKSTDNSYLVVEGVINSGSDTTFIRLGHTVKLDSATLNPETNATVAVEGDDNSSYQLSQIRPGVYYTVALNLPVTHKYRLHIHTSNNEYISDYVENKITPAIDSLQYSQINNGVQIYINAHDAANATRYYRWDYDETWDYYAANLGVLTFENNQVVPLNYDQLYYQCYKFATPSNNIFTASTAKLTNDVLSHFPLAYVNANSGKLAHVYSILVRQYALTGEGYNYFQNLKKNTEQLGSIFDTQPSQLASNIHSTENASEPVLGYVSVSTVTTKRYFIEGRKLSFYTPLFPDGCQEPVKIVSVQPANTLTYRLHKILDNKDTLLINQVNDRITHVLTGYIYAPAICVDCRLLGGTNHKPSYWPY